MAVAIVFANNPARAAGLLRFYWFRLSDVAVPMGVALAGPVFLVWVSTRAKRLWPHNWRRAMFVSGLRRPRHRGRPGLAHRHRHRHGPVPPSHGKPPRDWRLPSSSAAWRSSRKSPCHFRLVRQVLIAAVAALSVVLLLLAPATHMVVSAVNRATPVVPRADRIWDYWGWVDACRWIAESGEIPPDARFLTPLMGQTFKWYAQRSEVVSWKDVPQDAESMAQWWHSVLDIYRRDNQLVGRGWHNSLARLDARRLRYLGEKYDAPYLITFRWPRKRNFRILYENRTYIIYRMDQPPLWLNQNDTSALEPPTESFDPPIDPPDLP